MIFETNSPRGYVVVYTEASRAHTEEGHPEMEGMEGAIKRTVEEPHVVYRSKDDPDNRELYFRLDGHPDYPGFYLTVVVEKTPKPSGVITAFPQPKIRGVQEGGGLLYVRPGR